MKKLLLVLVALFTLASVTAAEAQVFVNPVPQLDGRNKPKERMRIPVLPLVRAIPPDDDPQSYCTVYAGKVYGVGQNPPGTAEWLAGEGGGDCFPAVTERTDRVCIVRTFNKPAVKCTPEMYDYGPRKVWNKYTPRMGVGADGRRVPGDYKTIYYTAFVWRGFRVELTRESPKKWISR